ncbi:hypothetical protein K402DRAFT_393383 [Aulographum hederae CBS 113979]|uniref:Small ribosomal subunit protein uS9m n=1 Tax=Aulographum hederae CBS 113979 TaxID=1176131 RepID=A0A6G1H116_9PEZI|nr:hypothetical protein K402DRAFT_393383 [Aulographum hederae CBS 113979]
MKRSQVPSTWVSVDQAVKWPARTQCFAPTVKRSNPIKPRLFPQNFTSAASQRQQLFESESSRSRSDFRNERSSLLNRVRIVPASPSYFTAKPTFTDSLLELQALLRKYQTLPLTPPGTAPQVAWKTLAQWQAANGDEPVKPSKYGRILSALYRLNQIHPQLMPEEVQIALDKNKKDFNPYEIKTKPSFLDRFGRAYGVGRRKTSSARAWVVEGEGDVLINGKNLAGMFGRIHDRESAVWPLKVTDRMDKYNVWALVEGGGVTGQAEALTLAISQALIVHEPLLKSALRQAGCVTRDRRRVERKKPGHVKARKMPAWVKR